MKLASYSGTRPGIAGLANIAIRARLRGQFSHSEIVFEPGDGVGYLMPDGTLEPDANGALWCASSTASERLPSISMRRAGSIGGVRLKRIVLDPARWVLRPVNADPLHAALWAIDHEGMPYDWQLIMGYVAWMIPQSAGGVDCSEACAEMLQMPDPWRFDPCSLEAAASWANTLRP